jgi:hypothetical protein
VESEAVTMIQPPRFASWLLAATLLPDAEAIAGDLVEELQERARGRGREKMARVWFTLQVARSLAPLFFRSWQRASVTRASAAMLAAAAAATMPAAALLSLRSFALSQVALKTTAELSPAFALALIVLLAVSALGGFALGTRLLHART